MSSSTYFTKIFIISSIFRDDTTYKSLYIEHIFFLRSPHSNNILHGKKMDTAKCCRPSLHRESISFMKGVMDECTHMANFSGKMEERKYHNAVTDGAEIHLNRSCDLKRIITNMP